MLAVLYRLLIALTVVAFVGGMTVQAMPSAQTLNLAGSQTDPDCPRMAMEHPDHGMPQPMPCKGVMPDCVKQMGCLGSVNLAARSDAPAAPVLFGVVAYWRTASFPSGRDVEPELFPPIDL